MQLPRNAFKHALEERRLQIGLWSQLTTGLAAELLARAGFDWIVIDTEHSPTEVPAVLHQLQALAPSESSPVVRVAWNDPVLIKRILDIGAQTVLVPFIETAEDAEKAVAATRYPPLGIRGVATSHRANQFGRIDNYLHIAAGEICVLVQIETRRGLENAAAIASVAGVDGVFVGPSDLSGSLGHLGDPNHPEVREAVAAIHAAVGGAGKPIGTLAPVEEDARRYIDMGFTFVAVGSDVGVLARHTDALARSFAGARDRQHARFAETDRAS
ncbi:HpcH/HpaI aldolase/citrate lyase family protein [Microbaculum marinum]|uniref:HpcH/HpaI aldolase/citrate lyase family protein n=1 Tax=Microbaculum marinum TaxID=1764581 RepID=A0AAW9RYF2_9HYPH